MDNSKVIIPDINELNIYEGGTLNEIKITDLMNNETAIKQLINTHNLKIKEIHNAQKEISTLKAEIEFQKTAPFVAILALIVNIGGSTIMSFAVNLLSVERPPVISNWLLVIGGVLVITGSLATILYPYARNYYNNKTD